MILFSKNLKKGKKWIYEVCLYSLALVLLPAILSVCFITENSFADRFYYTSLFVPSRTYHDFNSDYFTAPPTYRAIFPLNSPLARPYAKSPDPYSPRDYNNSVCTDSLQSAINFSQTSILQTSFSEFYVTNSEIPGNCRPADGSWYAWDSFYVSMLGEDGSRSYAKLSDYFDGFGSYSYSFTLPLTTGSNPGLYDSGDTYDYYFSFRSDSPFLTSDTSGVTSSGLDNLHVRFNLYSHKASGTTYNFSATDLLPYSDSNGSLSCDRSISSDFKKVSFHCLLDVSAVQLYQPTIYFSLYDSRGDLFPIWFNDSDIYLDDFYVITDGIDNLSSLSASVGMSGSDLQSAPGYDSVIYEPANDDFFEGLTNLFSFSVFNPFAPIFNLFTNGQSCASIPIIAGMLHAESDEYCSWFPSSVRSVLTPVFSLASVMLLFGFIVRWLGSSSGNFFEDSKSEEVSNQGGRWGHFKRGGK